MIIALIIGLVIGILSGTGITMLFSDNKDIPERLKLYTSLDQPFMCNIERYHIGHIHFIDVTECKTGRCELRIQAASPEEAQKQFEKALINRGGFEYFPGNR